MVTKNERLKANITAIVNRLIEEMDMRWSDITIQFSESDEGLQSVACVQTQWEYRHVDMLWSLPLAAPMEDEEIENHAIHELCHVLCGPIHKYVKGHRAREELTTQNIASAIRAIRANQGKTSVA